MKSLFLRSIQNKFISFAILAIIVLVALRIGLMPLTPPGFFLDEAASGAHAVSLLHHGTNAHQQAWPLFSESLGGGYTTPIYLYPLAAWAGIFGTSELSLRYFSQVATLLAIAIIAVCVSLWTTRRTGLLAAIAGLALPWGWLQGSLAWDPALVPLILSVSLLAFSLLVRGAVGRTKIIAAVLLPISLVALAYLYPPMRVGAPLLFIAAYAVLYRQKTLSLAAIAAACIGALIIALPLAQFMFQPQALGRSQALSVFYGTSLLGGIWHAFINYLMLLNPWFLFGGGDPNLRHSTGFQGMLGVATLPALIALIVAFIKNPKALTHNMRLLVGIGIVGVIASLAGSALTNEGQPHSLRATAAWPFALLLIACGWQLLLSSWAHRYITIISVACFVIATTSYVADVSISYPARSASSFDTQQRQAIFNNQPQPSYPGLAKEYYRIR